MKDLGRIRRLFYRDGMSLSEISRKTGYSRNTVKRWLRTPEGTEPKYERQNPNIKIAPYAARLIKALGSKCRIQAPICWHSLVCENFAPPDARSGLRRC